MNDASRRFLGYSAGSAGIAVLRQVMVFFPMFFYCPPAGKGTIYLDGMMVGIALLIGRLMDVLSDPAVGYLSDRTTHRWGKRLPYIVIGAPLWIVATVLLFTPPGGAESMANFYWLIGVSVLFFLATTAVQIPYTAVLPEITGSEDEAVRVSARMGKFYMAGVLVTVAAGWPLASYLGFVGMALAFGLLAAVSFAFAIAELFTVKQRPVVGYTHGFVRSALTVITQKPFITYLVSHSLFMLGYYMMLVATPYLITEVVGLDKTAAGGFFLLAMLTAIGVSPLITRLGLRLGKKPVMLGAMVLYAAMFVLWNFIGRIPWVQGIGTTAIGSMTVDTGVLVQAIVFFAFAGVGVSVQMLLPNAIVADLVIYDERTAGERRESLVYGLQGGIEKNAVMIATLLVGFILKLGNTASNPAGIYMIGPVATLLTGIGFAVFLAYPLRKGWQNDGSV
jgi:GPH family glycoside/pentoside/hexuronide:cation symporter